MFVPITSPEEFLRILKREPVESVFFTIGKRMLVVQTTKRAYFDVIVAYSYVSATEVVIYLRSGVVLKSDTIKQGRTVFLTSLARIDDIIAL